MLAGASLARGSRRAPMKTTTVQIEEAQRDEAESLIGMVAPNLDKAVSHGKPPTRSIKNMPLHSREVSTSPGAGGPVGFRLRGGRRRVRFNVVGIRLAIRQPEDLHPWRR